jgi:hypothetical protein
LFDAAVHRGLQCGEVTNVDFGGHDPAVQSFDQVGGFSEVIRCGRRNAGVVADRSADVDRDDVGALLRQSDRVAAALAARRTGDERDLSRNSSTHVHTFNVSPISHRAHGSSPNG